MVQAWRTHDMRHQPEEEEEEEDAKVLRLTLYIFYLEQITI
jgi:hypothetical protein